MDGETTGSAADELGDLLVRELAEFSCCALMYVLSDSEFGRRGEIDRASRVLGGEFAAFGPFPRWGKGEGLPGHGRSFTRKRVGSLTSCCFVFVDVGRK